MIFTFPQSKICPKGASKTPTQPTRPPVALKILLVENKFSSAGRVILVPTYFPDKVSMTEKPKLDGGPGQQQHGGHQHHQQQQQQHDPMAHHQL